MGTVKDLKLGVFSEDAKKILEVALNHYKPVYAYDGFEKFRLLKAFCCYKELLKREHSGELVMKFSELQYYKKYLKSLTHATIKVFIEGISEAEEFIEDKEGARFLIKFFNGERSTKLIEEFGMEVCDRMVGSPKNAFQIEASRMREQMLADLDSEENEKLNSIRSKYTKKISDSYQKRDNDIEELKKCYAEKIKQFAEKINLEVV